MAVVNKYVRTLVEAGKLDESAYVNGSKIVGMVASEEFAAGDDAGSIYRFFKGLNPNLIPIDIKIYVDDEVAGADEVDVGLYEQTDDSGVGAVIDIDCFGDDVDLSPAGGALRGGGADGTDEWVDGMKSVDIADLPKKLYEHAGHDVTDYTQGYDLVLTCVSECTTGGTVTVIAEFLEG